MTSSKIKEKNVIFKKLSCWYWENVALYGWAGIPANGQGLFCAKWIYTVRSAGERGGPRAEKFLCVNFAHLAIKCEFYFTEESAQVVQRLHFKTDKERAAMVKTDFRFRFCCLTSYVDLSKFSNLLPLRPPPHRPAQFGCFFLNLFFKLIFFGVYCFTMLCYFLLYSKVKQLYINMKSESVSCSAVSDILRLHGL